MLRTPFASERIQRIDPKTGIKVIQLTSYPLPAAHFLYDWPFITPDNQRIVLFSQREIRRDAPWDLFRVDADGLNLFQLSEYGDKREPSGYYGRPASRLTLNGKTLYVIWGHALFTIDVETGATEELCSIEPACPEEAVVGNFVMSADERRLFVTFRDPVYADSPNNGVMRIDLDTGELDRLDLGGHLFACDPTGPRLVVTKGKVVWATEVRKDGSRGIVNAGDTTEKWITDEDGNDIEYFCPEQFAHATLLGRKLMVQGCGKPPHKCIWLVEKGQEPRKLIQGPYCWHSGPSRDGKWIVADTNWPDQGLQLIHVPTGHFTTLCHPGATQDHYEFGHPHPALSHDGRLCVFRSDRTGVPQLYAAHITDEFRERVIAGDLNGSDKWML